MTEEGISELEDVTTETSEMENTGEEKQQHRISRTEYPRAVE